MTLVVSPFPGTRGASAPDGRGVVARIEVHLEILADRREGPAEPCAVVQAGTSPPVSLNFWGTFDEAGTAIRCGGGTFTKSPEIAPSSSSAASAPFLIHEISANVGCGDGAGDPGPAGALQVFLTLRTRQSTGPSGDGRPRYGAPLIDRRTIRLEPGEEVVVPHPLDARGREVLGIEHVLVRVRAGWAGRDGTTEYGALSVTGATPASEVLLDGGVAGHAGPDGSLLLRNVPVGQREVRLRSASGSVTRTVLIVKGRTVPVTPEVADVGWNAPGPPRPAEKNAQGFQEYRRARDGAMMVEIPAGEFLMGDPDIEGSPQPHTVFVSRFLMDKLPLTVGRYRRFATATGRPLPPDPYWGMREDDPVAFVLWEEAKAYCEWAGGRLPTEAEREKATRGTDGRKFAWGSEPPSDARAVFGRYWGAQGNDTVGIRPAGASPYGLLDTGGSMWEFCEDWYDANYYASSPKQDPTGPKTGTSRVVRGASWDSRWVVLYAARRNFAHIGYREGDFGFRCAANLPARETSAGPSTSGAGR